MTHTDISSFRDEVRSFLTDTLTPELTAAARLGFGISRAEGTKWHRALFEKGWVAPQWPVEFGGTGWDTEQRHVFSEQLALAGAPMLMPFGLGMVGPVIYSFGSSDQQHQHLPGILDGSVWWCQGYSEPGSGSDLASLRTNAVRDGEHYVVNGQKIWTTNAHKADWIFALVRTDTECKPQQGISFLLIEMDTPGLEVKPIISIDGMHHLNEVYFNDVRVPLANLIGEENKGWTYAKFLLGHERTGIAGVAESKRAIEALHDISATESSSDGTTLAADRQFMTRLADTEVQLLALEFTEARMLAALKAGTSSSEASSTLKILGTQVQQALQTLRVEAVAHYALPFDIALIRGESNEAAPGPDYALTAVSDFNFGRASSIYGGSNEIQRNVIAKAVLEL